MIQKKICMLGTSAVGKTSLVVRFVESLFSEKYLTTIGVKIDKKTISVDDRDVNLVLWDLHGEDEYQTIRASYLRGASGYFLVVDGTRRETLDRAIGIQRTAEESLGLVPFLVLVNKSDLTGEWDLDDHDITSMTARGWTVLQTSAKTGTGVEEAFVRLTRSMVGGS